MAITAEDRRLVAGKIRVLERLDRLAFDGGEACSLVDVSRRVLTRSVEEHRSAIRRERVTEQIRSLLREPQDRTADALIQVYDALKRQYAERRARGEALREGDRKVERLLRNLSPAESLATKFPEAMSALKGAADFASERLPEDVVDLSAMALHRARDAGRRLEKLGERALRAYSNIEGAREQAKSNYLAVRDMISAACRLEGRYGELDGLVPPISDVIRAGRGGDRNTGDARSGL